MVQQHSCFVQIFIYTTVYSKIKDKKIQKNKNIPYLPTHKVKNKLETDLFSFWASAL